MLGQLEKLAAKAGFQDDGTAKGHYDPLLDPDHPGDAPRRRYSSHDNKAASQRVKTEILQRRALDLHIFKVRVICRPYIQLCIAGVVAPFDEL